MYNSMYAKLPDPLSRMQRLKGVVCETSKKLGPADDLHTNCQITALAQSHDSLTAGMYKCHNCWVSSLFNLNRPHSLNNQSDPTFVYAHPYRCIHPDPSESRLPQVIGPFSQGWGLGMRLHLCDDSMNRDGSDIPYNM